MLDKTVLNLIKLMRLNFKLAVICHQVNSLLTSHTKKKCVLRETCSDLSPAETDTHVIYILLP